jgi:hypothetical protein
MCPGDLVGETAGDAITSIIAGRLYYIHMSIVSMFIPMKQLPSCVVQLATKCETYLAAEQC